MGSKDLTINLYQNVVDIPIDEKNNKVYHYSMFSHFADTAAKPTDTAGKPATTTTTTTKPENAAGKSADTAAKSGEAGKGSDSKST